MLTSQSEQSPAGINFKNGEELERQGKPEQAVMNYFLEFKNSRHKSAKEKLKFKSLNIDPAIEIQSNEAIEKKSTEAIGEALFAKTLSLFSKSDKNNDTQQLGFEYLLAAVKNGYADAHWLRAYFYFKLRRLENSDKYNSFIYDSSKFAAEHGCDAAYDFLGHCHEFGIGVVINIKQALQFYESAVQKNITSALHNAAYVYQECEEIGINLEKAQLYYIQAANQGYLKSMAFLADIYKKQGNKELEMHWLQNAAEHADQSSIGKINYYGKPFLKAQSVNYSSTGSPQLSTLNTTDDLVTTLIKTPTDNSNSLSADDYFAIGETFEEDDPKESVYYFFQAFMLNRHKKAGDKLNLPLLIELFESFEITIDPEHFPEKGEDLFREGLKLLLESQKNNSQPTLKGAAKNIMAAAAKNLPEAQFFSAYFYLGIVLKHKLIEAYTQYSEVIFKLSNAAAPNCPAAMDILGGCYELGIGVAKNLNEAKKKYQSAADKGIAKAQFNIARCLEADEKNKEQVIHYYQLAADANYAPAQINLGMLYDQSKPRNKEKANKYFLKAAEQGNAQAEFNLGVSYHEDKDYPMAAYWYTLSLKHGEKVAGKNLWQLRNFVAVDPEILEQVKSENFEEEIEAKNETDDIESNPLAKLSNKELEALKNKGEAGNVQAQLALGNYFMDDDHLNQSEAEKWLNMVLMNDSVNPDGRGEALYELGNLRSIQDDLEQALILWKSSAEIGYALAEGQLKRFYNGTLTATNNSTSANNTLKSSAKSVESNWTKGIFLYHKPTTTTSTTSNQAPVPNPLPISTASLKYVAANSPNQLVPSTTVEKILLDNAGAVSTISLDQKPEPMLEEKSALPVTTTIASTPNKAASITDEQQPTSEKSSEEIDADGEKYFKLMKEYSAQKKVTLADESFKKISQNCIFYAFARYERAKIIVENISSTFSKERKIAVLEKIKNDIISIIEKYEPDVLKRQNPQVSKTENLLTAAQQLLLQKYNLSFSKLYSDIVDLIDKYRKNSSSFFSDKVGGIKRALISEGDKPLPKKQKTQAPSDSQQPTL